MGLCCSPTAGPYVLPLPPPMQVGGWTVEHEGLTFASVRGAGHMVPYTQVSLLRQALKGASC